MDEARRFAISTLVFAVVAFGHAIFTWPLRSTIVLFVGGAAIAFVAEAVVVGLGLLRHYTRPQIAGVPVVVLFAWPATVYVAYRTASLVVPAGVWAAALAAVGATLVDGVLDPVGIRRGRWSYPKSRVSEPRFHGVPWWNFAGWLAIVFVTATVAV